VTLRPHADRIAWMDADTGLALEGT
jgi:hypothetical protein